MKKQTLWRVLGASVTGTSHMNIGRDCDDFHGFQQVGDSVLIIAVADGAGSSRFSARGAEEAVHAAINTCRTLIIQNGIPDTEQQVQTTLTFALQEAHTRVASLVKHPEVFETETVDTLRNEPSLSIRDFATTLILTLLTPKWTGIIQIGDGATVVLRKNGSFHLLSHTVRGEYINETDFLTDDKYLDLQKFSSIPSEEVIGVISMTDGLEILAIDFASNAPFDPFFLPLIQFMKSPSSTQAELEEFLRSEKVCARTDDDKTLVLAILANQ